jgi:F-type H+-transporting ATPase subunit epsilon
MDSFKFELVSPERLLVSEDVHSVVVPGSEGEMTVMARHAPVVTTMRPGIVVVETVGGEKNRYVVYGGFADITAESCTLLAEFSVHERDFDREDLAHRMEETKKAISETTEAAHRTKLEEFLHQLTTLGQVIVPA